MFFRASLVLHVQEVMDQYGVLPVDVEGCHQRTLTAVSKLSKIVPTESHIVMEMISRDVFRELQKYVMWTMHGNVYPKKMALNDDLCCLNLPIWGRLMAMKGWEPSLAMHGIVRRNNSAELHGLRVTRTLVLKFRKCTPCEDHVYGFYEAIMGVLKYILELADRKLLAIQTVLAKGDLDIPHKDLVTRYETNGGEQNQSKDDANLLFSLNVIANRGDIFLTTLDGKSLANVGPISRRFNRALRVVMAEFRCEYYKELKLSIALTTKLIEDEAKKRMAWAAARAPEGASDCFCDEFPSLAYHSYHMCRPLELKQDLYLNYLLSLAKSVSRFQATPPGIRMFDGTTSPNVSLRSLGAFPVARVAPSPPPPTGASTPWGSVGKY